MTQKRPSLFIALIPVAVLIALLAINVLFLFSDTSVEGPNQFALIFAGATAAGLAMWKYNVTFDQIVDGISHNLKDTTKAVLILLLIGGLAGSWLISGVIPAMVYYGLQILHPSYFLAASLLVCAVVSLATGSSWGTSATVGLALMGIGSSMGMNTAMVAGAVISGAYFGDKLSPMSDTTNLAPAMAGTDLFTHIKYMLYTTIPSIVIALILFIVIGLNFDGEMGNGVQGVQEGISEKFNITPWLLLVPALVILMIARRVDAIIALFLGILIAVMFAFIFQPETVTAIGTSSEVVEVMGEPFDAKWKVYAYAGVKSIITQTHVDTSNPYLVKIFSGKGMSGMLNTIFLIITAMIFGGAMEAAGFLKRIANAIISMAHNTASLIASTLATCGLLNVTASDQYLAIVVPGKMYKDIYKERGLAPENLSRSLEDGGTVTSVLVPWNTCGAYQSATLGVATGDYWMYCFFNILSPFVSLAYAVFGIKIKKIETPKESA